MSVLDQSRFVRALPYLVVGACLCVGLSPWIVLSLVDWMEHRPRHAQQKAGMAAFILALKEYDRQYGKLPVEALPNKDPKTWQRTQGAMVQLLLGQPSELNPQHIKFYEPPLAKAGQYGLTHDERGEPVLVDNWGEPFYFLMDMKGEGKVSNPDPGDNREHPFIEKPIVVFSAGADRDPNTWKDNVMSWK